MNEVDLIKDRIDVVSLIGEYVQLKPAGANWKGLCPFHGEKSPSFMANRDKQIWHCFGCSKGGDIFSFIQEIEGMEFIEALRILAERAGVTLTSGNHGQSGSAHGEHRSRLREILSLAAQFYHKILRDSQTAEPARQYLMKRGLRADTIERFQIGFIPDGHWTALTDFLTKKKGFGVEECVAAGVTKQHERGRCYDTFRARVMFPLWDVHGSVVGFTGRLLQEQEGVGKYVNTPDTELFDKSQMVYALHFAKQAAKQAGHFVVVEGQMDVISCHQAGMENVVAASGTALTTRHVQILKRYVPELRMAFDGDSAGERAAKRGIDIALTEGMDVKVIQIPVDAGKDPDECIQKDPAVWKAAVESALPVFDYYIARYVGSDVRNDARKLREAGDLLAQELARINDALVFDFWAQKVSSALGASVEAVKEKTKQYKRAQNVSPPRTPNATANNVAPAAQRKPIVLTRHQLLSEYVLCIATHMPAILQEIVVKTVWLSDELDRELYTFLLSRYTKEQGSAPMELGDSPNAPTLTQRITALELLACEKLFGFSEKEVRDEYTAAIVELKKEWAAGTRRMLAQEIRQAESRGEVERVAELIALYQNDLTDV